MAQELMQSNCDVCGEYCDAVWIISLDKWGNKKERRCFDCNTSIENIICVETLEELLGIK